MQTIHAILYSEKIVGNEAGDNLLISG